VLCLAEPKFSHNFKKGRVFEKKVIENKTGFFLYEFFLKIFVILRRI
jgi:hypothetical protein